MKRIFKQKKTQKQGEEHTPAWKEAKKPPPLLNSSDRKVTRIWRDREWMKPG